jgi:ribonucleoside-diphosphate reductase alpha chain
MQFRNNLGETIFKQKYANFTDQTWSDKARQLSEITRVAEDFKLEGDVLSAINDMKFIPGGRYLYYAGRGAKFYNNCFIFKSQEDSRESWAELMSDITSCLMAGGGIGNDYSIFRPHGSILGRTGGEASGPIPLMEMVNEAGRNVMQGGSRRSAMYASLNWSHGDIERFLHIKDWEDQFITGAFDKDGKPLTVKAAKEADFNYRAPLDMTNISVNYDDNWLEYTWGVREKVKCGVGKPKLHPTFLHNVRQAMKNGEPGFSFNFNEQECETGRNACTEVTSSDDGDVCNLGSVNMSRIDTIEEFAKVVALGTKFLLCGTIEGELPTEKIHAIRTKNRRLGLGLMGVHEWLLQRGYRYEVVPELHEWLAVYRDVSNKVAREFADKLGVSRPIAVRSIAPTGTIGILAGTTTGIEPVFAVAYKRRYLQGGSTWLYQLCIDSTAKAVIEATGCDPDKIETAYDLSKDPERRIKFQAEVQDYVDMAISSTLNLPPWGSEVNCEERVVDFANIVAKYAHKLRGLTFYPDGSRGGQPITSIPYNEAVGMEGVVFEENDGCKGGVCGL